MLAPISTNKHHSCWSLSKLVTKQGCFAPPSETSIRVSRGHNLTKAFGQKQLCDARLNRIVRPLSLTYGVFLPNAKNSPTLGSLHTGGHTTAYHDIVNDRILAAAASGDKIVVLNELALLKADLLAGVLEVQNAVR